MQYEISSIVDVHVQAINYKYMQT